MTPRPYQEECVRDVGENRVLGYSRQLVVLPTGTGKTVVFANLLDHIGFQPGEKILFLCHMDELVIQTVDKFQHWNPHLRVTVEKASQHADLTADMVVASVQTLWKRKRLEAFDRDFFQYVVFDETHLIVAEKNLDILRWFRVLKGEPDEVKDRFLLGGTATPDRTDHIGLERVFQVISYSKPLRWFMENGIHDGPQIYPWLCDIKAYRVETLLDLNIRSSKGDLPATALAKEINTPERNKVIIDNYEQKGEGLQAFAFTANVQHSVDLAQAFRDRGWNFEPISGETPLSIRRGLMERFAAGELQGLCSCEVLGVGVDQPRATVGLGCRPTMSRLKFTQWVGRILRPFPSPEEQYREPYHPWVKPYAIWIDFADNTKHSIVSVPSLFGLRREFNPKGGLVLDTLQKIESLEEEHPSLQLRKEKSLEDMHYRVERVNLLKVPTVPDEIRRVSTYSWVQTSPGYYMLPLMNGSIRVSQDALGIWNVTEGYHGQSYIKWACVDFQEAIRKADALVPIKQQGLLSANAEWTKEEPTLKQCLYLFTLSKEARAGHLNAKEFYAYALAEFHKGNGEYSKGSIRRMIDSKTAAQPFWMRSWKRKKKA